MSCFVCKHTGEKVCDAEEAEIRCMVCNRCERDAILEQFQEDEDEYENHCI